MGWSWECSGVWLLFFLLVGVPWSTGASLEAHSYDCGEHGMQLLVVTRHVPNVLFKVFDEFGNVFEVKDCSECHHFLSRPDSRRFIFSTGYHGCHVLQKGNSFLLKVRVELITESQEVTKSLDVEMVCPKPETYFDSSEVPSFHTTDLQETPKPPTSSSLLVSTSKLEGHREYLLPANHCHVDSGRILCGHTGISNESCQRAGCCYDPSHLSMPCYYGNKVTAQCTLDGFFLVAISRDMLDFPILLDTVHLPDNSPACHPSVKTDHFVLFHVPLTRCGATFKLVGDRLVYETTLSASIHVQKGPRGSITRDITFALTVRCSYSASDFLPLEVEVLTPPPFPSVTGAGPLHLEMRIARDAQYNSYYTEAEYPVTKVLRDPVYMEVRILHRSDPRLILVLQHCWATPTSNPMQGPQWPILVNRCPFLGDNYQTVPVPVGPALPFHLHYQRFSVATFAFLDATPQKALMGQVYFFCSASACQPSVLDPCVPGCHSARQRRFLYPQHQSSNSSLDMVSSHGPVLFLDAETLPEKTQEHSESLHSSHIGWALFWTLAAFFVAVAIFSVVVLWYRWRQPILPKRQG